MRPLLAFLISIMALGCGQEPMKATVAKSRSSEFVNDHMSTGGRDDSSSRNEIQNNSKNALERNSKDGGINLDRKIIYTANIDIIVRDFEAARQQLLAVIPTFQGYISNSDIASNTGAQRSGRWTVRVPVEKFAGFTESVLRLGNVQQNRSDARDVTDEYVDLEARIKSKQVLEQRLAEIAKAKTEKVADLLEVERELNRVRGEIEQAQGRKQMLQQLTSLSTISVSLREIKDYVPPSAPSFAATIKSTFTESIDSLVSFGKFVTLILVAITPWLPFAALAISAFWIWRQRAKSHVPAPVPEPPVIL